MPPTPTSMRIAAAPCEMGGFALPKGAIVFFSPFLTHRDPSLYEEPDRFQPDRWATLSRTPYEYLPFAAGSHRCLGTDFALLEIKVVLAMLLQRFRLAVLPYARIEPVGSGLSPAYGIAMRIVQQDRRFESIPVRGSIQRLIQWGGRLVRGTRARANFMHNPGRERASRLHLRLRANNTRRPSASGAINQCRQCTVLCGRLRPCRGSIVCCASWSHTVLA